MSLDHSDVEKIAHLARLEIDEKAFAQTTRNLSEILDFVEQLKNADTADVSPMAHPVDAVQRLRQDVVTETDQREHFQAIAPQAEMGLYLVPKVIE